MEGSSFDTSEIAGSRASAYALIAAGFRYPTAIPFQELDRPELWERLLRLGNRSAEWSERCSGLRGALAGLGNGVHRFALEALEDDYSSLFGHAVRGSCPPYELEYGPGEIVQRAPDLADIAGFYAAFGLEMSPDSERPDHVTAECEFMAWLCFKEAEAHRTENSAHVEQCQHAQRAFLKDHVSRWLPAFARRIAEQRPQGFYARLAGFASVLVEMDCRCFGLPPGPETLALRPIDPERDTTIECGSEESCVPGGQRLVQLGVGSR